MRVTKTIREFIEKEVSNRLDAKYAAEKEEANFQTKVEQEVWEAAMDAAQKAYDEYMRAPLLSTVSLRTCIPIRNAAVSNSASTWRSVSRTDRAITASSAGADARTRKQGLSSMTLSWKWNSAAIRQPLWLCWIRSGKCKTSPTRKRKDLIK